MMRAPKGKRNNYDKFFLNKRSILFKIIIFIITIYLSFFITYFLKKEEPLFLRIKQVIIVFILSYLSAMNVKKIILVKNMKMLWIYPVKLKEILLKIFRNEYINYILISSAMILPDLINNDMNAYQALLLLIFPFLITKIGLMLALWNINRKSYASNITISTGILFSLIFLTLQIILYRNEIIFLFLILIVLSNILLSILNNETCIYEIIYKYSYNFKDLKNIFKIKLKAKLVYFLNKLSFLKNRYLYTREVDKLLTDEKFEIKILRGFLILISCLILLNNENYNEGIFFDATTLLSAANIFSTSSYYNEKFISTLCDILPMDNIALFKTKTIFYSFLWVLISFPFIIMSFYKAKIFWIIKLIYIFTNFISWSLIGIYIDMSLNGDKFYYEKNIYSRFFVMIIAIIYIGLTKDILLTLNLSIDIKAIILLILNVIFMVLIWRKVHARIGEPYKSI